MPSAARHRLLRTATALSLAALALPLAACGSSAPDQDAGAASPATYDAALHRALPQRVRTAGVLHVTTDASYAPASGIGPDGHTIVGFEPDLGDALGRILGVKVEMKNTAFSTLLDGVEAHLSDLSMSAITDTPEREHQVDFVNYFSAGTSIVVQRGNATGITDLVGLCGQDVAVEKNTTQVDLLARSQRQCHGKPIAVHSFDTNADALLKLRTGRVRAVLNDYPPAVALSTDAKTRSQYQLASTTQYEPGLYGIAVAKDDTALRDAVAAALGQLIRSGAYADVLDRWNVSEGAVRSASINGASVPAAAEDH
jgi:polar amino acid transport system substrate-binding protein